MLYNERVDKKQYARYKKRLGGDAPRNFFDIQKMKYDEAENYGELKSYYRYKGCVPEATKCVEILGKWGATHTIKAVKRILNV